MWMLRAGIQGSVVLCIVLHSLNRNPVRVDHCSTLVQDQVLQLVLQPLVLQPLVLRLLVLPSVLPSVPEPVVEQLAAA